MNTLAIIITLSILTIFSFAFLYQLRYKEQFEVTGPTGPTGPKGPRFIGLTNKHIPDAQLNAEGNMAIYMSSKESVMPDPSFYLNPYEGNLTEKSMNKYKVKLEGEAQLEDGKIKLKGNNSFLSTNFKPNFDNNTEYTLSLWFKDGAPGIYHSRDTRDIITTALISNYGKNHTWEYTGLHIDGHGRVNVSERNSSRKVESVTTKQGYADGKWHHIAKVATAEEQIIYVDGEKIQSTGRVGGRVTSPTNNIVIGGSRNNRYQTAELGPVQIFADRALTDRQLKYVSMKQSQRIPIKRSKLVKAYLNDDMIVLNGRAHRPLKTPSLQEFTKGTEYVVIDQINPNPREFKGVDKRMGNLQENAWQDQPWSYYVIFTSPQNVTFKYRAYVPEDGTYKLGVRIYTNGSGKNDSFYIAVNDEEKQTWHTGRPRSWAWRTIQVNLKKGINTISLIGREPTPFSAIKLSS